MHSTSTHRRREGWARAVGCRRFVQQGAWLFVAALLAGLAPLHPASAQRTRETTDAELRDTVTRTDRSDEDRRAALRELAERDVNDLARPAPGEAPRVLELIVSANDPGTRAEALAMALETAREVGARIEGDTERAALRRRERFAAIAAVIATPLADGAASVRAAAVEALPALYGEQTGLEPATGVLDGLARIATRDSEPALRLRALEALADVAPATYDLAPVFRRMRSDPDPRVAARAEEIARQAGRSTDP